VWSRDHVYTWNALLLMQIQRHVEVLASEACSETFVHWSCLHARSSALAVQHQGIYEHPIRLLPCFLYDFSVPLTRDMCYIAVDVSCRCVFARRSFMVSHAQSHRLANARMVFLYSQWAVNFTFWGCLGQRMARAPLSKATGWTKN